MISRRRILSRSRDELMLNGQYPDNYNPYEEEEDVWYSKDKLMKDHILEILNKWEQIDDGIWAKLICMERNRRVAKAYARAPTLSINGSDDGFDGYQIGLNGFDNPLRDPKTDMVKQHIGDGVEIRIDQIGNILIKRLAKSNIYVKGWQTNDGSQSTSAIQQQTSVSNEIIRNNGLLEMKQTVLLFDMERFKQNMNRELKRAYPDRRKLENQCFCCIGFVKDAPDLLNLPVWIMVINIVAMHMLKSNLPLSLSKRQSVPNLVSLFDRQKSAIAEEDPYSIPGNNSSSSGSRSSGHYVSAGIAGTNNNKSSSQHQSGSNDPKPPKLPPRDFERKNKSKLSSAVTGKKSKNNSSKNNSEQENNYPMLANNSRSYDDPYYSGFSARVPNFAKKSSSSSSNGANGASSLLATTQMMLPFKSAYNNDFQSRKVPTRGFLNSFITSPNVIHSRTASYQSYYGSLGESDPYTLSSETGGTTGSGHGDDSFLGSSSGGGIYGESPYGTRIGMAARFIESSNTSASKYHHNGNQYLYNLYNNNNNNINSNHNNNNNNNNSRHLNGKTKSSTALATPFIYHRYARNMDDYYGVWDE